MKYVVGAVRLKCSVNDCSKTNSSHCCSAAVKLNKLQSRHCSAMHSPLTRIFLLSSIRHHSTNADFSAFQMSPFVSVWDFLIWNWELRDLIFQTLTKLSTVFVVQFISFVNNERMALWKCLVLWSVDATACPRINNPHWIVNYITLIFSGFWDSGTHLV